MIQRGTNIPGFIEGNVITIIVINAEGEEIGTMLYETAGRENGEPGGEDDGDGGGVGKASKIRANTPYTPTFMEWAYTDVTLDADASSLPSEFAVEKGYPNPFNPTVTVSFAIPATGEVIISVYNILGQQVFKNSRLYEAGYQRFLLDTGKTGRELGSGVYFLQIGRAHV